MVFSAGHDRLGLGVKKYKKTPIDSTLIKRSNATQPTDNPRFTPRRPR